MKFIYLVIYSYSSEITDLKVFENLEKAVDFCNYNAQQNSFEKFDDFWAKGENTIFIEKFEVN